MTITLILVLLIISPILAYLFQWITKFTKIPTMLLFILLGILVGDSVLHLLGDNLSTSISLYGTAIGLNIIFILAGFGINIDKIRKSGKVTFLYSVLPVYISGIIGGLIGFLFYEILLSNIFDINLIGILLICSIFAMGSPVLVNPLLLGKKKVSPHGVESIISAGSIIDNLTMLLPAFLFLGIGLSQVSSSTSVASMIETIIALYIGVAIVVVYGYLIGRLIIKLFNYLKIDNMLILIALEILVAVIILDLTSMILPIFSAFAFLGALGVGVGFNTQIKDEKLPVSGQNIAKIFGMFAVPVYFTSAGLLVNIYDLFNIRLIIFAIVLLVVLAFLKAYTSKLIFKQNGYTSGEQNLAILSQSLFGAAAINMAIAFLPFFTQLGIPDASPVLLYCGIISYIIVLPVSSSLKNKIENWMN